MNIIKRKGFYYIKHSFKKNNETVTREKYLGKKIPEDIDEIKNVFLRKCFDEEIFLKLEKIRKNFSSEWKNYPLSIKKKILLDLSINFTYNTNAIEGSTITLQETEELLKRKISPNKPLDEVIESLNHSKVFLELINTKKELCLKDLISWHQKIFVETKPDISGRLRDYSVKVADYRAPDWQDLNILLEEFFIWLNKNKSINPVELAARAHYKFEKIHPFGDGNGRIGRLIIASILRNKNYPLITIPYKKRKSYYHALTKKEEKFLQYFIKRYITEFKEYNE